MNALRQLYNKLFLLIIFTLYTAGSFSQKPSDVSISRSEYRLDKMGFKEAWGYVKMGEDLYDKGAHYYKYALPYYLIALEYNAANAELNYKTGICYLYSDKKYLAEKYLYKAYKQKNAITKDIHYYLGLSYQYNLKFTDAKGAYDRYKNYIEPSEAEEKLNYVEKRIRECDTGIVLIQKPLRVNFENVGIAINSIYPEYSPVITPDGNTLFFTSRRPTSTGGEINEKDNSYYEDVYSSHKIDGVWQEATNICVNVNTKYNDASVGISPDGNELYIYNGLINGGDIFKYVFDGKYWINTGRRKGVVNTQAHEGEMAFAPDGNTLYFVSDRGDVNFGKHDIYRTEKNAAGIWSDPINMGRNINSSRDERCIFIGADGKTIYFASDGRQTIGGFDIFYATYNDSTQSWNRRMNMGYPINTPEDEMYFSMNPNGREGYYTAVKKEGVGGKDIYKINFLSPENLLLCNEDQLLSDTAYLYGDAPVLQNEVPIVANTTLIKGAITTDIDYSMFQIEVTDNEKHQLIATYKPNPANGSFIFPLENGKNYGLYVSNKRKSYRSINIDLKTTVGYSERYFPIEMSASDSCYTNVLDNVFFVDGEARFKAESLLELERFIHYIKANPKIKLVLNIYSPVTLFGNLAERRARLFASFLIKNKIRKKRYQINHFVTDNQGNAVEKVVVDICMPTKKKSWWRRR